MSTATNIWCGIDYASLQTCNSCCLTTIQGNSPIAADHFIGTGASSQPLAMLLLSLHLQPSNRFYKHTVLVIAGLLCAHLACFIASVVLIDAQRQYIDEVVDAGSAVITMHRMAIDCR